MPVISGPSATGPPSDTHAPGVRCSTCTGHTGSILVASGTDAASVDCKRTRQFPVHKHTKADLAVVVGDAIYDVLVNGSLGRTLNWWLYTDADVFTWNRGFLPTGACRRASRKVLPQIACITRILHTLIVEATKRASYS